MMLGKGLKWTMWASFVLFFYHLWLLKKEKPEEGFLANHWFLEAASFAKFTYEDLTILLTRPPVSKLLLDRPPLPPGSVPFKVLVLNLNGTLIHSEYKLGSGFEIVKRPGLSVFLQRMAR